jgi:hypothetical protein
MIKINSKCPATEYSVQFLKGMLDRMYISLHKYGLVKDAPLGVVKPLANVKLRLKEYRKTGNTEFLMDAANFLMIEFMFPQHPKAHFKATDSHESPGRKWDGEVNPNQANNSGV